MLGAVGARVKIFFGSFSMRWWRRTLRSRPAKWAARIGRAARWTLRLLLLLLVADLLYIAASWPDWHTLSTGPVPKSAFIKEYERVQAHAGANGRLRWQPVPLTAIPRSMQRAVVVAEDSRFFEHSGFDLIAFKEAIDYNLTEGRFAVGASTISQQTVKNLFLSSSKTPWRKWHELVLTWGMERHLSKQRIMELYLNIAEFGPGIYGVQAAAQSYWGVGIGQIDARQAAELAATLPSPSKNNPGTRTHQFEKRAARILRLLIRFPGVAAEAVSAWRAQTQAPTPSAEDVDVEDEHEHTSSEAPPACDQDCTEQAANPAMESETALEPLPLPADPPRAFGDAAGEPRG